MKNIMKRAWEIFRTLTGDRLAKLSQALKMAWAEVKNAAETVTIEQIATLARSTVERTKLILAMPIEKLEAIVKNLEDKINATSNPAEKMLKNLKESIEMVDLIKRYKAQQ